MSQKQKRFKAWKSQFAVVKMMGLISYSFPLSNPPCAVFFKDSRATHGKGSMSVNPQIDFSFALLLTVIDPKNLKKEKNSKIDTQTL